MEALLKKQPLFADFRAVKEGNVWCASRSLYQATDRIGVFIDDLRRENSQPVEASVELHQPALDKSTGVINFTTDVTFQINRKSAPYLLSYVLVADGLTGTSDDWK